MEDVVSIGSQIVDTIVSGVTGLATGITGAVVDTWNGIMLDSSGNLSGVATWGLVFVGIGVVMGFVRKFTAGRG